VEDLLDKFHNGLDVSEDLRLGLLPGWLLHAPWSGGLVLGWEAAE
jgi:hypothetical protein